ncbi:MAG TPA: FhaA domain-containing protein, partial [Pyrinomonadaceae bacterium]
MSVLDKVRRWIDGDNAELVLEEAARDAQVKPRSQSEEFIVKIARAVEDVMQKEMVPLPQGTTIIPTEYIIFLSNEDDKEWQGIKRRGLEQGLYHILAERAKEISGKKKLETKTFVVELRVDGTLEKGDVRIQHSWEDSSNDKTGVLARPKHLPQEQPTQFGMNSTPQIRP